jgi:ATP/maltotriose-dependent transcriptional regulator MalT/DNA-binding SARP family transcriptional activator
LERGSSWEAIGLGAITTLSEPLKAMPPVVRPGILARPRLERLGIEARARRLTSVIADAGYGKSTLLAVWASQGPSAWYTADDLDTDALTLARGLASALEPVATGVAAGPWLGDRAGVATDPVSAGEALAAAMGEALARTEGPDTLLVIDDAHVVTAGSSGAHFLAGLVRGVPAWVHVCLGTRVEPPFASDRLRAQGQARELTAATLRFTRDEQALLLATSLGEEARGLASALYDMTDGWPAAVHLALEALRDAPADRREGTITALASRPGSMFDALLAEVIAREPAQSRLTLQRMAAFDRVPADLLAVPGLLTPTGSVSDYARRGLLVEMGADGSVALHWLLRRYLRERLALPTRARRDLLRRAARWLQEHDRPGEALDCLREAADRAAMVELLRSQGGAILERGSVREVLRALEEVPEARDDEALQLLEGQARMVAGDTQGALACLERAAGRRRRLPAGLAWRMGLLDYLRGETGEALETFLRGRVDTGDLRDRGLLLAWTATGHWSRGDLAAARSAAGAALELANATRDDRCLAATHTVLAMLASIDGDNAAMEGHSATALVAAERAGDTLQAIRILTNRASHRADDGRYVAALDDLEAAIARAEVTGYAFFLALALSNRGDTLATIGQLEAAVASYDASLALYRRMGSRSACYPLQGLGDVHRVRGDLALARAAYGEAIGYAQGGVEWQALAPTLAGLARCLPETERATAWTHARRAVESARGPGRIPALLAAGWLAAEDGSSQAPRRARDALAEATSRGDPAGLAEALELSAAVAEDDAGRRSSLEEALAVWGRVGNPVGVARVELALARLDPTEPGRRAAETALRRLSSLGVRVATAAAAAGPLRHVRATPGGEVVIVTLGGFAVHRDGTPVDASEWQSRKARDLVKILVARRGRRIGRETLMELLWPEDEPGHLANRLSVALATARGVLERGRGDTSAPIIRADADAVWLDQAAVAVDVERFLTATRSALEAVRRPPADTETIGALTAAEAAYTGEFLEEDAFADWAVPLREEARAAYVSVARALAIALEQVGDREAAARYTLRILERDPYDEDAHMLLVMTLDRAGRHGEARRQYRAYVARMRELDVEPMAFPVTART